VGVHQKRVTPKTVEVGVHRKRCSEMGQCSTWNRVGLDGVSIFGVSDEGEEMGKRPGNGKIVLYDVIIFLRWRSLGAQA